MVGVHFIIRHLSAVLLADSLLNTHYLVKLADAYFDETYATRIRRVMEECSRGQKTEKITNIQQGMSNDEVNPDHRGRG